MKWSYVFVEISAWALFFAALFKVRKKNPAHLPEYLVLPVYGFLLEVLDMYFFKSYHYSPDFIFQLMGVPVSIALLWAVILAGAMAISDASGLPETVKPFADALLALWMDLALDAIAIRMNYWTWAIPLDQGWFGVPAGNLYAWMWVAFFFSVFARSVRGLCAKRPGAAWLYLAVPFAAYIFLFIQLNLAGFAGRFFGLRTPNQRLWLFAAQFIPFLALVLYHLRKAAPLWRPSRFWAASRFFIHGYFLACFFIFGIYRDAPLLGPIAFAVLAVEFAVLKKFQKAPVHG